MRHFPATRRKVIHQVSALAFVALLGVGAAACGSNGGGRTQNAPSLTQPAVTPTTAAPNSGGAGF